MARVTERRANKDYPSEGIKKGDTYYSWSVGFRGKLQRSKTKPKRSQLTANNVTATVYDIYDDTQPTCADDVQNAMSQLEDAISEEEEKLERMPEGFKDGDTGQRIQERIDSMNSARDELSALADALQTGEERTDPPKDDSDTQEYFEWDAEAGVWKPDEQAILDAFGQTEPGI